MHLTIWIDLMKLCWMRKANLTIFYLNTILEVIKSQWWRTKQMVARVRDGRCCFKGGSQSNWREGHHNPDCGDLLKFTNYIPPKRSIFLYDTLGNKMKNILFCFIYSFSNIIIFQRKFYCQISVILLGRWAFGNKPRNLNTTYHNISREKLYLMSFHHYLTVKNDFDSEVKRARWSWAQTNTRVW